MKTVSKITIIVISVLLLTILTSVLVLSIRKNNPNQVQSNNFSGVFLPNFNDVRGTADRGSEKWVAAQVAVRIKDNKVTFFSQKDGLAANNTTGVINHNNQIWFTSQGGASKYIDSENRFKTYLDGESNINLFEDPYDKKLYASTVENFFIYNDKTDEWSRVDNGPINSNQMKSNQDFIIATSQQSKPAVVFNKQDGNWTVSSIPDYGDQEVFHIFKVGERIFIYGRSKNYNSCNDQGKEAASLFFEFKNGKWAPVDILNKTFINNDPSILKSETTSSQISFYNGKNPCSGDNLNSKYLKTVVDFSNNSVKIISQNETPFKTQDQIFGNDYTQIVQEISNITGLKSSHKILSYENNTILSQAVNPDGTLSFTQIALDGQNYSEKELLSNKDLGDVNGFNLTNCSPGNVKYLSAANVSDYDGSGKNFQLYELMGNNIRKVNADVSSLPFGNPNQSACFENNLYWPDGKSMMQTEIQGEKIDVTVAKDLKDLGSGNAINRLLKDGKLWFSYFVIKDKLFSFDLASKNIDQYSIPLPMDKLTLLDVTPDYFWFSYYLNPNSELVKFDRNGNAVRRYAVNGPIRGISDLGLGNYLVSSSDQLSILNDNSGEFSPVDDKLLPFYSKPTDFMPERSNFDFVRSGDNVLFENNDFLETGNFIIPVADLIK